jgi:hypothetical protein
MSGHFATLLRDTARTLLRDHDVQVTDWHNVRDVPFSAGRFGLDEYIDHLIEFTAALGLRQRHRDSPALRRRARRRRDHTEDVTPRSRRVMLMVADRCRIGPTAVNKLATSKPIGWFEKNLIGRVPWRLRGAGRRVYPGFLQLSAFISMNRERHVEAFRKYFAHLAAGEEAEAKAISDFYNEYMAVADLSADFYLGAVGSSSGIRVPLGKLTSAAGRSIRWRSGAPRSHRRRRRDDICAIGRPAAQELTRPRPWLRTPTQPNAAITASSAAGAGSSTSTRSSATSSGFAVGAAVAGARCPRFQAGERGGLSPATGIQGIAPPWAGCTASAAWVAGFFRSRTRWPDHRHDNQRSSVEVSTPPMITPHRRLQLAALVEGEGERACRRSSPPSS